MGLNKEHLRALRSSGWLLDALLGDLVDCSRWRSLGRPFAELDLDLLFYQDDIFSVETDMVRLARRIRAVDRCLGTAGLQLATTKTKIVSTAITEDAAKSKVGEHLFQVAPLGEAVKVLGIPFSLVADASEQPRRLLAGLVTPQLRTRDILAAPGPWKQKVTLVQKLVEAQFLWIAGALHWSSADLHALNVLQIHACRHAFGLRRHGENMV